MRPVSYTHLDVYKRQRVGCNYKAAYALSLTLRYFPDTIRNYQDIALAQQSRGLDLSRKEKLGTRVKNVMNICLLYTSRCV